MKRTENNLKKQESSAQRDTKKDKGGSPALSRRHMMLSLGVGIAALSGRGLSLHATLRSDYEPAVRARDVNNLERVQSFDLKDVRLTEGPFSRARSLDGKYLLKLEPDRLLHNFRVNVGLTPKAPVYDGWESNPIWDDIRAHGHTLGHYLSACSMMFASTGESTFKERVDYIVAELKACQVAGKAGLICAFPDNDKQFHNFVEGKPTIGVPWYTTHKVLAGLRDAHLYANNPAALSVLASCADWAGSLTQNMSEAQFQKMLETEHGGMNEVLTDLYALTGNEKYLKLAQRFCHLALLEPLSQVRDTLDGLHSNTQIPKIIGFARLYDMTGRQDYLAASRFFWSTVVGRRSFAAGGNGDGEHFFPPAEFSKHLQSAHTMETCCSYNMLKLTRALYSMDPRSVFFDYYERTLFNNILASQDPDSGMMTYYQGTRPGYLKLYCTPEHSFWCCTGTGIENHAKYNDSIYFRSADTLYVNLFINSEVNWKEKGVTVRQVTNFPNSDTVRLNFECKTSTLLKLAIRYPTWSSAMTISINGKAQSISTKPGNYIEIDREWENNDQVDLKIPMALRTEPLPGNPNLVAVMYGPILLVGALGNKGITPGADLIANERTYGSVLNESIEVPYLEVKGDDLLRHLESVPNKALTFKTNGIGRPNDVTLVPYYSLAHQRYNMYWKLVSA